MRRVHRGNIHSRARAVNKKCLGNTDCSQQIMLATFNVDMSQKVTEKTFVDWQMFGQWMRKRREEMGLSQEAAAEEVKIHPQTWYRLEGGASTKHSTMMKIARFLAIDTSDLNRTMSEVFKPLSSVQRGNLRQETVEDALDRALFFEQKGITEEDRRMVRPLLESADRMLELLSARHTHKIVDLDDVASEAERSDSRRKKN
jgi:transcriptional regulator with XRE-family HTH domain